MYEVRLSKTYKKKAVKFFKKHPNLYDQYSKVLQLLQTNPHHPSLRLHKLKGDLSEYHSVSLNMKYRILLDFIIKEDVIILIDIGGHELY